MKVSRLRSQVRLKIHNKKKAVWMNLGYWDYAKHVTTLSFLPIHVFTRTAVNRALEHLKTTSTFDHLMGHPDYQKTLWANHLWTGDWLTVSRDSRSGPKTDRILVDFEKFWCPVYGSFCENLYMRECGNVFGIISLAKVYPNGFFLLLLTTVFVPNWRA